MSLRRRFVVVLAAYGMAVAAVMGAVSWWIARDALEAELDRRLEQVAQTAAAMGIYAEQVRGLFPGDETSLAYQGHLERLRTLEEFVQSAFIFTATDYRVLVSTDEIPIGTELLFLEQVREEIVSAVQNGRAISRSLPDDQGKLHKYGFVRLEQGRDEVVGVLIPADFLEPVSALRATLLWSTGGALVVAVLLGGLLAASIVQPIEGLSRAALRIQRGRLDRPIDLESAGEDEVAGLARAMERMRVSILERDERLKVMLAQVAHELRNPLGGLELFASAAATAEDPRERRRLIDRVRSEVAALNRIIDDFLTFARPLNPDYEPVDLRVAVEEAADLAQAEVQVGGSLEVVLSPGPLWARADRDQVKRAVLNLLRNATQSGENVRVWAEMEQGDIMIAVADDGPGIAPAVRDRIFEPFVSDKEKGAGLGLSIVKKVADAHGGRVEVRDTSDPKFGSGAEFRLYLQASHAPTIPAVPAAAV